MNSISDHNITKAVLSSFNKHIIIIDRTGEIILSNDVWSNKKIPFIDSQFSENYLLACAHNYQNGNKAAGKTFDGIKSVLAGKKSEFELSFPFSADGADEGYNITVRPLNQEGLGAIITFDEFADLNFEIEGDPINWSTNKINTKTLLEKSQLLKASIQLARIGIWQLDLMSNRIFLDSLACKIFGLPNEQRIIDYASFIQLFHPKDKDDLERNFEEVIINGNSWNKVYRIKSEDNKVRYISSEAQAVLSDQGAVLKIICVSHDISEQEEVKMKLARSEEKAKILFDYSPIIIWEEDFSKIKDYFDTMRNQGVTDFRKYLKERPEIVETLAGLVRFTQMNQPSLDFYQVETMEDLIGNLGDWFVDDSWKLFTNELIALAEGKDTFEGEVDIITPKGEPKRLFMKLSVPPQYKDTLETVLVSFLDITELKNKEKLLQESEMKIREYSNQLEQKVKARTLELSNSESKLKVAQRIAQIGYWEWDVIEDTLEWSQELDEIYELEKGKIKGINDVFRYIHPDDLKKAKSKWQEVKKHGYVDPFYFRISTPSGGLKNLFVSAQQPLLNEKGEIIKVIGINQDVTEVKKIEKMEAQVQGVLEGQESERERIAKELHDSINPLLSLASLNVESVLGNLNLNHDVLKDKLNGTVSILENAIQEIREISRNLSPAALKSFGLILGLKQLCHKVRTMSPLQVEFRMHAMEERLSFKTELALYRIAQELFNNILKHAAATEVELQLIKHSDCIILMMSDNGIGFHEITTEINKGIGLGNIRSRVQSLNGQLTIDSSENSGTTTIIEIPT